MLEAVLGAVLLVVFVGLTLGLPIASFVLALRARRIAAAALARVAALEGLSRPAESSVAPAVAEPVASGSEPEPAPPASPTPPRTSLPLHDRLDLEQQIGSRWLLYAGIAAVVLGSSYFVKFAFDSGWISEPLRVAFGILAGLAMIVAGLRFHTRGLPAFGQALAAGGIVILYLSVYAAVHFYNLISPAVAFGSMVAVTAGGVWMADRQRAQPLAMLALIGGFGTPLLIGGRGSAIILLSYLAILVLGSAWLARRHAWPLLSVVNYLGLLVVLLVWAEASYEPGDWLRTELFLSFYVIILAWLLKGLLPPKDRPLPAQVAATVLLSAPLAYHVASIALLNDHPAAWLLYLVLATVAGLLVSQRARADWLRVVVLVLIGVPAAVWLNELRQPAWYAAAMATMVLLYGLHLAAQWEATDDEGGRLPTAAIVHAQLNGLLLPAALYVFLDERMAVWNPWMTGGLAAANAALAVAARRRTPSLSLQFVVLSATLAAATIVLAFDGPVIAVAWAAEGAFVGWLALRERSRVLATASAILLAFGSVRFALLMAEPLPVGETPLLNVRVLAAVLMLGTLTWLASRIRSLGGALRARDAVIVLANLVAVLTLSAEIVNWFDQRALFTDEGAGGGAATLAGQMALSVAWALYAVGLIAAGIRRAYAPARYLGILFFAVTILKVLGSDLAGLDRFHRMLSVLGVGVLLLLGSYLYQRRTPREAE